MRLLRTTISVILISATAAIVVPSAQAAPVRTSQAQRTHAAALAQFKAGSPYGRGAAGPRSFDCSGLVGFAYRTAGVDLGVRTSFEMARAGAGIARHDLQRGDLVFTWDRAKGHVGIYLGMGRYVHSPAPGRRVAISPLPAVGAGYFGAVRP